MNGKLLINKKGSKSKAENYHPVSLIYVASELLENTINRSNICHLEKKHILNGQLHIFRQCRSGET